MTHILLQRAGILVCAVSLLVPTAWAQSPQQPQENAPVVEASAQEIARVAELLVDIEEVQQAYQYRFRRAKDADNARAVQGELKEAINRTINTFEGLAPDRYDEIVRAAQADDELRRRILTQVEENRAERQSQAD